MGQVLDRWRLNQGWNPWDNDTQSAAIKSYVYTLDAEKVPLTAYMELYERSLRSRVAALQSGKQLPNFGVELMLAEWLGPHGLRNELKTREIDAGRTLTSNAESICPKCDGTGMERTLDPQGRPTVRKGCRHEHSPAEEATMAGFDAARAATRQSAPETATQIVKRLRAELARDWAAAEHNPVAAEQAWDGQRTLRRIERHILD